MKEITAKNGDRFEIAPYTDDAYMRSLRALNIKRGPDGKSVDDAEAVMELVRLLVISWVRADGTKPLDGLVGPKARQLIATTVGLSDAVMKWAREARDEEAAGFETDSGN
ncbi:MAG: hypothetical protein Q8P41_31625 [Pseudomonadota bacterium]|nr:hypothetical protein [Pseudomonadota bacterium]